MPSRLREAVIKNTMPEHLVGHGSRDSTAIEGREKATPKPPSRAKPRRKPGVRAGARNDRMMSRHVYIGSGK